MKRELVITLAVFILFSTNVLALNETFGELGDGLNSNLSAEGIQGKTNDVLSKEVQIPENLQFVRRVLFGINFDATVDLQKFIVLICMMIIVLIIFKKFYTLFQPSQQGLESWIVSLVFTLIAAASGGLLKFSAGIISLSGLFGAIEDWHLLVLVISLIMLLFIFYVLSKLIASLMNRRRISDAEKIGESLGTSAIIAERTAEAGSLVKRK